MLDGETRQLIGELADQVLRFRARVFGAAVLLILAKVAAVTVPLVLKAIVDVMSRPEALAALPVFLLGGYAAVRFAATLFTELRDLTFARVTQTVVSDLSLRTFEHLHSLATRFHVNRATGQLTREIERGTVAVGFLTGTALFQIVPTVFEIAAVLVIMIVNYGWLFSLLLLGTFLLYAVHTTMFLRRRTVRQRRVNAIESQAHRRLVDSLLNYETVKSYANERFETEQLAGILRRSIGAGVDNQIALTYLHVGQSAAIALGIAAVMLTVGSSIVSGGLTVGDLVLVNAYVIQVCLPLNSLGFVIRESNDALVRAEKLFALLRLKPEPRTAARDDRPPSFDGAVRFEGVSFGYELEREILSDVSFTIEPGTTVAIVGGSGSGKSTLARLLLKLFEPNRGCIKIGDTDLKAVDARELRGHIGLVPQDTTLFNDTIEYNIAYGRVDASREEIVAAAKAANVHDFVSALPHGYATLVGERGLKLSGGEKQRIAIARAMLKNPPILILDEATSALDSRAEQAIRGTLERLAAPRTTLVIAHRLSAVVNAHEILVLEAGRIVERGRHRELLERDGLYARMWALQEQERELRLRKRRARLEPVNLAAIALDAIEAARPALDAKGVHLYTTLSAEGATVTGDHGALHEVVTDLVEHAVAISEPGARVEVTLERQGNEIVLRVSDTWAAAEPVQPAFPVESTAPVHRFDPSTLRVIVEEHHGRFKLAPAEPLGTTYTVAFPVRAVALPAAAAPVPDEPPPVEPSRFEGKSLLVVDDDEDAREALKQLLEIHHATVATFGTGGELYEYLRERSRSAWPDLLICDIGLPEEDGYRLLKRVRSLEAQRRVPLAERMAAIALTGYAEPEDRTQALIAGFQAHLAKPAMPDVLLATAQRLLPVAV
ncbi:MAG TPA: ATP-binding cassette domain-containing protein [Gammaproteobacteria bacterium]|nr:ATP-binding cassette domain-containing protein [Gammaproteobacteria bacterium]